MQARERLGEKLQAAVALSASRQAELEEAVAELEARFREQAQQRAEFDELSQQVQSSCCKCSAQCNALQVMG